MQHHDDIDPDTGEKYKLVIVTTYNKTKGVVDIVDKLCVSYSKSWPVVIFYNKMNVAGIDCEVTCKTKITDTNDLHRQSFLRVIAKVLIHPQLQRRAPLTLCSALLLPCRYTLCRWKKIEKLDFLVIKSVLFCVYSMYYMYVCCVEVLFLYSNSCIKSNFIYKCLFRYKFGKNNGSIPSI